MGEKRNSHRVLVGKSEGRRPVGKLGLGGFILLKWFLNKWTGRARTRFIWLWIRTRVNEISTWDV
jgi:hypothetical protein